jgi:arylsulfatase A-like enzyme
MHVPLGISGPGAEHIDPLQAVRAVDLMPTILELLGQPVPPDLDGRSLYEPPATHNRN